MRHTRPAHWLDLDWEAKARENPLLAIMTTEGMADAPPQAFTPELLEDFFARGRQLFDTHLRPLLGDMPAGAVIAEYGCGAGRILKAVAAAGFRPVGIDISPTMIGHCRELVPEALALHALDGRGRSAAADGSADLVFSYSVLQHISLLSAYLTALDEMCRVLAPGGVLAVQLNSEDFKAGLAADPWRTENHETYSLHYRNGAAEPYKRHEQDQWSGVYIGYDRLVACLTERGVGVERWYYHNPAKPRAIWVIGRKASAGATPGA